MERIGIAPELVSPIQKALEEAYTRGYNDGAKAATNGVEVVKARAWRTEKDFGYDRWRADQYSMGEGTHDALIVVLGKRPAEISSKGGE